MNALTPARSSTVTTVSAEQSLLHIVRSRAWAAAEDRDEEFALQTVGHIRSHLPPAMAAAQDRLKAGSAAEIVKLLTPALALVGAAGLNASDREEWLIAAAQTLKDVPFDLLKTACATVARYVDHPSKIVAAITSEVEQEWGRRRRSLANLSFLNRIASTRELFTPPAYWRPKPGETDAILDEVGLPRATPKPREHLGARRMPTREDYIALGVSPDVLDRIEDERAGQDRAA